MVRQLEVTIKSMMESSQYDILSDDPNLSHWLTPVEYDEIQEGLVIIDTEGDTGIIVQVEDGDVEMLLKVTVKYDDPSIFSDNRDSHVWRILPDMSDYKFYTLKPPVIQEVL